MEWIKDKYDRLFLGAFGVIAIALGGLLATKAMTFKKDNFTPRGEPEIRTDFGADDAGKKVEAANKELLALMYEIEEDAAGKKVEAAKKLLAVVYEFEEPVREGRPVHLFVSTPVLKKAGSTEDYKVFGGPELRPPIANAWFYNFDLDITRQDIADMDTDGDGFTNREEYNEKWSLADPTKGSNPRDAKSMPASYSKVKYVETVTDPMTLMLSILDETEANIKRTEPAELKWAKTVKKGEAFPVLKDGEDKRFRLTELKPQGGPGDKDAVVIEDLLDENKKYDLINGTPLQLPTTRAKLISSLVEEEEKVVTVAEEFTFKTAPEQYYKVVSIEPGEIALETWYGAEGKKETIKLPISSAP